MPAPHRQPSETNFLGEQNALVAEAAADVGRNDANLTFIEAKTFR
jgi:hypothetical protein